MDRSTPPIEVVDLGDGDGPGEDAGGITTGGRPWRLLVGAVVLALAGVVAVVVWPRGDDYDDPNVYFISDDDRGRVATGPPAEAGARWTEETGTCPSVQASLVAGDIVISHVLGFSFDSDIDPDGFVVIARSVDDGAVRWEFDLGDGFAEVFADVGDGQVLVASSDAVSVLDGDTGDVVASIDSSPQAVRHVSDVVVLRDGRSMRVYDTALALQFEVEFDSVVPVHVVGDTIIVLDRRTVTAYDIFDGDVRWTEDLGADAIAVLADVVVVQDADRVRALDRSTGRPERWGATISGVITAVGDDRWAAIAESPSQATVYDGSGNEVWTITDEAGFMIGMTGDDGVVATVGEDGASIRDVDTGERTVAVPFDQITAVSQHELFRGGDDIVEAFDLRTGESTRRIAADDRVCGLDVVDDGILIATDSSLTFYG